MQNFYSQKSTTLPYKFNMGALPPGEEPKRPAQLTTFAGSLLKSPYAAIVRLSGPQAKRAAAERLLSGDSGGPGKIPLQNRQAGVPQGGFMD